MDDGGKKSQVGRKRSSILYQITALVVILMVTSGVVIFLFVNDGYNRMVEKSVNKVVEEKAKVIDTGMKYMAEVEAKEILGDLQKYTPQQLLEMSGATLSGELSEPFLKAQERMKKLVEERTMGVDLIIEVLLATPPMIPESGIMLATDDRLMERDENGRPKYRVPDVVLATIEDIEEGGESYRYLEDGIPEIGLEGKYLMCLYDLSKLSPVLTGAWGIDFVSMEEAVADINAFYSSEKNRAIVIIAVVVGLSVLLAILITFFVLSMLIRRQITAPIEELSAAAEQVMEGDLDVDIKVREGEEFEGLKRAFKEMVESFRKYIARSVGEE
ncbi:MAG: HAMP domain-containing protein [Actinobacteria bacterium]|nr:HAMP domain-containing protein [Actinomycetota bacterium]